jgi:HK97 family phage major capsid protein
MKDDSSALIWQPNAREGDPNRILGIPFVINNRNPVLGSQGDLALLDLNYYLIKEGSGPYVAASEHVYFTSNKTVIKAFTNIDGQSWLSTTLPLEGSTANVVSPFVVLTT